MLAWCIQSRLPHEVSFNSHESPITELVSAPGVVPKKRTAFCTGRRVAHIACIDVCGSRPYARCRPHGLDGPTGSPPIFTVLLLRSSFWPCCRRAALGARCECARHKASAVARTTARIWASSKVEMIENRGRCDGRRFLTGQGEHLRLRNESTQSLLPLVFQARRFIDDYSRIFRHLLCDSMVLSHQTKIWVASGCDRGAPCGLTNLIPPQWETRFVTQEAAVSLPNTVLEGNADLSVHDGTPGAQTCAVWPGWPLS